MFCPKNVNTSIGINMKCCMCMNDKNTYQYHLHLLDENKQIASKDSTNNGIVMWGRNGHCEICKNDSQKKGKHYHLRDCE